MISINRTYSIFKTDIRYQVTIFGSPRECPVCDQQLLKNETLQIIEIFKICKKLKGLITSARKLTILLFVTYYYKYLLMVFFLIGYSSLDLNVNTDIRYQGVLE